MRQRFVEQVFEAALVRKKQARPFPARRDSFDGAKESRLIALACSHPPASRARWTMEMLADRVVELKIVEIVSDETGAATEQRYVQYTSVGERGFQVLEFIPFPQSRNVPATL